MNPKNIIIAAAVIILFSNLLSGCVLIENDGVATESAIERLHKANELKKSVSLKLDQVRVEDTVTVTISLHNPEQKPITSVQSWFSFNPDAIMGTSVDFSNSAFGIPAPYITGFSEDGLLSLGRADNNPITDVEIEMAKVTFEVIQKEGTTMIDVYDYKNDLSGHTSVNILVDGKPYNILVKPESPALIIQNQ